MKLPTHHPSQHSLTAGALLGMFFLMLLSAILTLSSSCSSSRRVILPPATDSVETRVIHSVSLDTVFITLPPQQASEITSADSSRLETDYAVSFARILPGGVLSHQLVTKPHPLPVSIPVSSDSVIHFSASTKPVSVPTPPQPNLWEQTQNILVIIFIILVSARALAIFFRK